MSHGATITLKPPAQMYSGAHKIPLTKTQLAHFNKAKVASKGTHLKLSKAAISDMSKSG